MPVLGLWLIRITELKALSQDIRDLYGVGTILLRFRLTGPLQCGIALPHSMRILVDLQS